MNPAHLHLMLNHLPVIGVPLVAALLAWALFRSSREIQRVALGATVIVAALTYPVFLTGEPAEERIEDASWASENLIHEHEERAEAALIAVLVTGVVAVLGLWQSRGNRPMSRRLGSLTLAGLAVSAGLLGWTALLGGPIRHEEIRAGTTASAPVAGERDDD
jgi:NADH:ubiquinone oxidoreductase subunit 4 (subunit M)